MNIINQLVRTYYNEETWIKKPMSRKDAFNYHKRVVAKGNVIQCTAGNRLVGYVEFWRVNYEQLGRIVCNTGFSAYHENTVDGDICWLYGMWIDEEYRQGKVINKLKKELWEQTKNCKYILGKEHKRNNRIRIYKGGR